MAHRSPARWLAPIALLAALAAVGLVLQSTTGDETSSGSTSSTPTREAGSRTSTSSRTTTAETTSSSPKTYRVKAGDTLGAIAEATGVSIAELQELNPELDAQSLSVGQPIRLRR